MGFIKYLILAILLSNCSYKYPRYGSYSDVKTEYRAKKPKKVALHYNTSLKCSGGGGTISYCSNRAMLKKINDIFNEYNLSPTVAKKGSSRPMLEVYDLNGGGILTGLTYPLTILSLGIIPSVTKNKYKVIFSDGDYRVSNEEHTTELNGWFMIPLSKRPGREVNGSLILDGLLRTTLNQVIKDKKLNIKFKDISKEEQGLYKALTPESKEERRRRNLELIRRNNEKARKVLEKDRIY